jgi:hypothetical protein
VAEPVRLAGSHELNGFEAVNRRAFEKPSSTFPTGFSSVTSDAHHLAKPWPEETSGYMTFGCAPNEIECLMSGMFLSARPIRATCRFDGDKFAGAAHFFFFVETRRFDFVPAFFGLLARDFGFRDVP